MIFINLSYPFTKNFRDNKKDFSLCPNSDLEPLINLFFSFFAELFHLFGSEIRKILEGTDPEGSQKLFRSSEQERSSWRFLPAFLLDKSESHKFADREITVDAADTLHLRASHGLLERDNGQSLHQCVGQDLLFGLLRYFDKILVILRPAGELDGVLKPVDPEAAPFFVASPIANRIVSIAAVVSFSSIFFLLFRFVRRNKLH